MALPINIEELLHGKVIEWERLEFKQDWNPEPIMHTLCAFANDMHNWGGGYIIIGVSEKNGRPVLPPEGLSPDRIDAIQNELTQISHRIHPHYLPIAQPYVYEERHILVIWAPAGDMRPYSAPESLGKVKQQRHHYIRHNSNTIRAKGENLKRLQELTARVPYDDRINQEATLNDLDLGLIRDFLHEIKSTLADESASMPFADLARQLAIVKGPDEDLRPVNVGLMFFNREPERFFRNAWIEVVIREDEAGKNFSEKYFKGPLHNQLRDALGYLKNQIIEERVSKVSGKAEADRYSNFPYDALEEALANAVYHKSYELPNPIEVQVWPDRIEVLSFPGPVPPVDAQILAENKRIVARDYRNRRVGDFLKELHLTEGRGTGIPTMKQAMKGNGSPDPVLETDEQCTHFLTTLHVHPDWLNKNHINRSSTDQEQTKSGSVTDHAEEKDRASTGQVPGKYRASTGQEEEGSEGNTTEEAQEHPEGTEQVLNKYRTSGEQGPRKYRASTRDDERSTTEVPRKYHGSTTEVSNEVKRLVLVMDDELKRLEIQKKLGLRNAEYFRKSYLIPSIEIGIIEMTSPDKPNSSKQRYRLTEKGKALKEELKA